MQTIETLRSIALNIMGGHFFQIDDCNDCIIFEPNTRETKRFDLAPHFLDGKQIVYWKDDNTFEYSEYQAGPRQNELHIFANTKTFKKALNMLLSGVSKRPIEIIK